MSAKRLFDRVSVRNREILHSLRNFTPVILPQVITDRPLLRASHEMNLLIDCETTSIDSQTEESFNLKVRGAVARASPPDPSGVRRLTIIKDPASSVYLNFNVLKENKVVTLVELSQRHNHMAPKIFKDIKVMAYTPTQIHVKMDDLYPGAKYAVLVTHRANHLPRCREFLNSISLMHKHDFLISPLVRAFVNFVPGTPLVIPFVPDTLKTFGVDYALTYKQAPPGAGKTWALVNDAKRLYDDSRHVCFIIAPTNEVVLEICNRLSERLVKHNVSLSKEGEIRQLNSDYSLSIVSAVRKLQLEQHSRSPNQFNQTCQQFSNIYVMTVNKALTPKYENFGIWPTVILWDEVTLSSTCTFYSVLNKNPQCMVIYGDNKQGTPYEAGSRPDSNSVLCSPVNTFKIVDSRYHQLLSRRVRMKGVYGEFFLKYFYDPRFDELLSSYYGRFDTVFILKHFSDVQAFHPSQGDNKKSYQSDFNVTKKVIQVSGCPLVLVPYTAEKVSYDEHKSSSGLFPHRTLTFRPAQGQQANSVFLNFVKPTFSKFLTNTSCLVAMSRHINSLRIHFVPDLPKSYFRLLVGYEYDDSATISVNFEAFQHHFKYRNLELPEDERSITVDHNGDFILKWWFFLALLERALFNSVCILFLPPYNIEFSAFERLSTRCDVD